MHPLRMMTLIGLITLMTITHTGCFTAMGASVGASVDAIRGERLRTDPGWQTEGIKPDTPITLTLRDSTRVSGIYMGRERQTPEDYARRYAAWQTQYGLTTLPAPGERLTLFRSFGRRTHVIFQGFDYQQKNPEEPPQLYMLAERLGRIEQVKPAKKMVDSRGAALDRDRLDRMFLNGQIPVMSTLSVIQKDTTRVEFYRISSLSVAGETASRHPIYGPDRWEKAFKIGAVVTLTLHDSVRVQGTFRDLVRLPDSLYAAQYEAWWTALGVSSFPRTGDRITLTEDDGKRAPQIFLGFDYRRDGLGRWRPHILVRDISGSGVKKVELKPALGISDSRGQAVPADRLRVLFREGKLPMASVVSIVGVRDSLHIPADRVAFITKPRKKSGASIGAKSGAMIDLTIGLIVAAAVVVYAAAMSGYAHPP